MNINKKLVLLVLFISIISNCFAYTDEQICDAIYLAEGGKKAKVPYGILSVKCANEQECRQVCLNTVKNNRKRYKNYGYKKYKSFLEFLASRYAPIGVKNDPNNLNKNWLRNVKYFLKKEVKR